MNYLVNVNINFSCLTSAYKSLHLLCTHLLVIVNYDSEKKTVVVMVAQMQDCRGEFLHIRIFFLFCCCSQLKSKEILQIYIKKEEEKNTSRRQ